MKSILISFVQMIRFVKHDGILGLFCLIPLLCGSIFKFGIPALEKILINYFPLPVILFPYYSLFDLLLSLLAPVMLCFIPAMVILEETDEHIAGYLTITPLGKRGYLVSRLVIPALIAFIATLVILLVFSLTTINIGMLFMISLTGTAMGLITSLLIVSFSGNKIEGMAVSKLSSLMMCGGFVPFFISGNISYLASFLPGFWIAKAMLESNFIYAIISLIISAIWVAALSKKFNSKI